MWVRIQIFMAMTIRIQGLDDQKIEKFYTDEKIRFLKDQKLQFVYP